MLSPDDRELDGWIASTRPVVPSEFADRVLTRIASTGALERAARQRWIPRAAAAVAALIVIAGIAIVIIAHPAGSRTHSRDLDVRAPWNGSVAAESAGADREAELDRSADEIARMLDDPRVDERTVDEEVQAFLARCTTTPLTPAPGCAARDTIRCEMERLDRENDCLTRLSSMISPPSVPAAGSAVDREERVRDLVDALQAGDVDRAVAKLRVPLVHRTCSKRRVAETPDAAREVASCLAGLALIKHGWHREVRRSTVEELVRDARAASAASERSRGTDDLRALEAAYEIFSVKLSTRREPYHGEGYEAGVMYVAVDRAGSIGAIVLGPIMVAD